MENLLSGEFLDWLFKGFIILISRNALAQFKEMKISVDKLNTQIAVLITKDESKEKSIDELKDRVSRLENA